MFEKISRFMMGRYGTDKLNIVLIIVAFVISLIGNLFDVIFIVLISYAIMGYVIFRIMSRNIPARQKEYYTFIGIWTPIEKWFKIKKRAFDERKTYKYFKCPNCKQYLRAPKGKGKINVTCQKCHKQFTKKV
ncbi:MAG: hypothetical protein R3Y35_07955 [Clostridia bacterium]